MQIDPESILIHNLDNFDAFAFVVLGPLSIASSLLFIILNMSFKTTRAFPGNLLIIMSMGELCLSVHWFMTGIYSHYVWGNGPVDPGSSFCKISSYISSVGLAIQYCFLMSFFFAIIFVFRNTMKNTKFHFWFVLVPLLSAIIHFIIVFAGKKLGKNIFGICTVKSSTDWFDVCVACTLVLFYLVMMSLALLTLRGFKRSRIVMLRSDGNFFIFYLNYSFMMLGYYIITGLTFALATKIRVDLGNNDGRCQGGCIALLLVSRLVNGLKILFPIFGFLLRINDPSIQWLISQTYAHKFPDRKSQIQNLLMGHDQMTIVQHSLISRITDERGYNVRDQIKIFQRQLTQIMLMAFSKYYEVVILLVSSPKYENSAMDIINMPLEDLIEPESLLPKKNAKGRSKTFNLKKHDLHIINDLFSERNESDESDGNSNESDQFNDDDGSHVLLGNLESNTIRNLSISGFRNEQNDRSKIPAIKGSLNAYHPKCFSRVISQHDTQNRHIHRSFSLELNRDRIAEIGRENKSVSGGSSGQLIFVTHDRRFVIKTITETEEAVFRSMIGDYIKHLLINPDSLITRILGFFVFDFDEVEEPIKVVVMENIAPFEKKLVLRKYDLKGSTYRRKVLKGQNMDLTIGSFQNSFFNSRVTLKDLDFNYIEKCIVLPDAIHSRLLARLDKDVRFLERNQVIDFSLVVAIVKVNDLRTHHQQYYDDIYYDFLAYTGNFFMDSREKLGFFIGIIDYFEKYTFVKALERYIKVLLNCKLGLDTSSQPADRYAPRFMECMREVFVSESSEKKRLWKD